MPHVGNTGIVWGPAVAAYTGGTKTQGVVHYIYDADQHCILHAITRFGREALDNETAVDSEGNPVSACFVWSACDEPDYCSDCLYEQITGGID